HLGWLDARAHIDSCEFEGSLQLAARGVNVASSWTTNECGYVRGNQNLLKLRDPVLSRSLKSNRWAWVERNQVHLRSQPADQFAEFASVSSRIIHSIE